MSWEIDIQTLTRPGGLVPVNVETTAGLVREVLRLRAALFSIQCEQLDRGTNTERSAKTLRRLSMATRDRIIETLNGATVPNGEQT